VTGDGVMTKNHFRDNTTMYETDAAMAAQSIMNLKESADLIIPGHDNLIVNR
jgi:glyoxylase-like metal-dependent hydrolase (beta-lactamase superfamily II)